jgi:predicted kinase
MRKLIITRGLPGSGKSTTLTNSKLKDFTISSDSLRMLYSSPLMGPSGKMMIDQDVNHLIWNNLFSILEKRMSNGMTTVIDAVHPTLFDFQQYIILANKYKYDIACLDFTHVPQEYSEWTNQGRPEYMVVPKYAIDKMNSMIETSEPLPKEIVNIVIKADNSHIQEINNWLMPTMYDLSHYEKIIHIGDIQGCIQPLKEIFKNGLDEKACYIFVGDFCDRGQENAEVVRFLVDNIIEHPNVMTIRGNHEFHLLRDLENLPPVSDEYKNFTKKQFNLHGINHKDLKKLTSKLQDVIFYHYKGKKVMVNHGGLPKVPDYPWMIPSFQYEKGVGFYENNVDETFNSNTSDWFQVHGHRNNSKLEIINDRSINLEGSVEYGGYLRMATLDEKGFEATEIKNNSFRPWREREHKEGSFAPDWMLRDVGEKSTFLEPEILKSLREHPGVVERTSETYPFISSLSFTKDVFFSKAWDEVVNKARGLFIDNETGEIIARSYDKYFTVEENESMSLSNLEKEIEFPIKGRLKENGYLGILGYIRRTDELFISSKGSPDGDFAMMFKDLLYQTYNKYELESLKRVLRDWECSFTFEVIEPQKDPHIITYDKPKIVMLDVVRRSSDYEKLPYGDILKIGQKFNMEVAPKMMTLKDIKQFEGWYRKSMLDISKEIEGLVWTAKNGYMFKTKYPFYSIWKLMRGTKDAILQSKEKMLLPINSQFIRKMEKDINNLHENVLNKTEKEAIILELKKENFNRNDIHDVCNNLRYNKGEKIGNTIESLLNKDIPKVKQVSTQSMKEFLKTRKLESFTELADDFKNWCMEQDIDTLKKDIIELREIYKNKDLICNTTPSL